MYLLLAPATVFANKGYDIAKQVSKHNDGYVGEKASLVMILKDAHGTQVQREMESMAKEGQNDEDKSLLIFLRPLDVKGTKLLTWSHASKDDDQWLYLPSLKRVKRISSTSKSSSFMGSEFSYEDLSGQEVDKYTYTFIQDKVDKTWGEMWVNQRKSKSDSGYSKEVTYILKDKFVPHKVEYFDRKGELLKVATFADYQKYSVKGKSFFRANKIIMRNVQTKKESIITWSKREFGQEYNDRMFNKASLK